MVAAPKGLGSIRVPRVVFGVSPNTRFFGGTLRQLSEGDACAPQTFAAPAVSLAIRSEEIKTGNFFSCYSK